MLRATPENGEKTTVGVISKKATLHVQHTFLYISLPLFCTTTTRKQMRGRPYKALFSKKLNINHHRGQK